MKMARKRVYTTLLILISISFIFCNEGFNDVNAIASIEKIELRPFDISWSIYDNLANTTAFEVITNITIFNPNNFPVQFTFPTSVIQMIGTNASFDLESEISAYLTSICGGFE
jgi:glycopeptide antibiotics resistance protein